MSLYASSYVKKYDATMAAIGRHAASLEQCLGVKLGKYIAQAYQHSWGGGSSMHRVG